MTDSPRALDDLLVLDLTTSLAGAWCSRLLADYGAEVVLVEAPGGSPLRQLEPFALDPATGERISVPASYVLANKRSIELDAASEDGRALLDRLVERAGIVLTSSAAARDTVGAASADLPGLIHTSITPHGLDGGRAGWAGNDLTAWALSGWASVNGLADRPPLKGSGANASMVAGIGAFAATLAALAARDRDGLGQLVDVAEAEVLTTTFSPSMLRSLYSGRAEARDARVDMTTGPVRIRDGYFALTISRAHFWRDAMNLLGLTDLAEDQRYEAGWYRQQHRDDYVPRVEERMAGWTKMELFDALATLRVVAGPVLTMDELAENPHLRERGYFTRPSEANDTGPEYAGPPFRMSKTPWRLDRPAPVNGANTEEMRTRLDDVEAPVAGDAP
jgi:crotonobetainyl-CoA:carnitine CoA-transferase CaiB-like acyl-CoA transferase